MENFSPSSLEQILSDIRQEISERFTALEASVDSLARAAGKRRVDPQWVSISDAATLAGRSKKAIQRMIQREREKPSGFPLRVQHGAVHRQDFLKLLESKAKPGHGQIVCEVLGNIL